MAGRKPGGPKTGGRQKGTRNKRTKIALAKADEDRANAQASGMLPLDFWLMIMRDEARPDADRLAASDRAAPYLHSKLAPVDKGGNAAGAAVQIIFQGSDVRG